MTDASTPPQMRESPISHPFSGESMEVRRVVYCYQELTQVGGGKEENGL